MEIEVVYENGVFRPLKKPNLKEGTKLKIPLRQLKLPQYFGSIPLRIEDEQIREGRMENLERE